VSGGPREVLAAARTYYVRTDGSDGNNGMANTSGGAFLTIQKAIDTAAALDLNGFDVTIAVADGTYTGNVAVYALWVGRGNVTLLGNATTPANCLLSTVGSAILVGVAGGVTPGSPARLAIGGFKITTSSNGSGIVANEGSQVTIIGAMEYGAMGTGTHLSASRRSGLVIGANYTISGNAANHLLASQNSSINANGRTVTLTGAPVFSTAYANVLRQSGIAIQGSTFSGSAGASSKRYALATMGLIDTSSGGSTYLPGDTAGTNDGTGVYN